MGDFLMRDQDRYIFRLHCSVVETHLYVYIWGHEDLCQKTFEDHHRGRSDREK